MTIMTWIQDLLLGADGKPDSERLRRQAQRSDEVQLEMKAAAQKLREGRQAVLKQAEAVLDAAEEGEHEQTPEVPVAPVPVGRAS